VRSRGSSNGRSSGDSRTRSVDLGTRGCGRGCRRRRASPPSRRGRRSGGAFRPDVGKQSCRPADTGRGPRPSISLAGSVDRPAGEFGSLSSLELLQQAGRAAPRAVGAVAGPLRGLQTISGHARRSRWAVPAAGDAPPAAVADRRTSTPCIGAGLASAILRDAVAELVAGALRCTARHRLPRRPAVTPWPVANSGCPLARSTFLGVSGLPGEYVPAPPPWVPAAPGSASVTNMKVVRKPPRTSSCSARQAPLPARAGAEPRLRARTLRAGQRRCGPAATARLARELARTAPEACVA